MPNLSALENIELAIELCKNAFSPQEMLEKVGLGDRMHNFPAQLSGGEQQRVSIARALAKNPQILLCDEPTGALDYQTGKSVLKVLQTMCRKEKKTVIVVTHNSALERDGRQGNLSEKRACRANRKDDSVKDIEEIEW